MYFHPEMYRLMLLSCVVMPSNAETERAFSVQNRIKFKTSLSTRPWTSTCCSPIDGFKQFRLSKKCGPYVSILAGPLSKVILPLIKVLLGSKRQARNFLDIYFFSSQSVSSLQHFYIFLLFFVPVILPLIKVLLGWKGQTRILGDVYILVILVSKQFATFLHIVW